MKKLLSSLFILLLFLSTAMAQERTVRGTVKGKDDGLPLPGVSVRVKGTTTGTQTGPNGQFTIKVSGNNATLDFTYIGYSKQSVSVGSRSDLSIVLSTDANQLNEVVIGALGIERQKKEIGYAATTVTNESVNRATPVNIANGLQGKVAGLNINTINTGVFENVKINLRGIRSLTGNNNPLLLLDGVPADLNYLSSLNPNDIENVTVLKGASGAALYGPDARNGVIVVSTKKGTKDGQPVITVSNATQASSISFFPKFQNKFGSGGQGSYTPYENWSWGPAFDGSTVELGRRLDDGSVQTTTYSAKNDRKEFFNTGTTIQNDISYAGKDFYLSFQDANIKGIVPHDKNRRTGARFNASKEYGKFKASFNANYIQQNYNVFNDLGMASWNSANNVGLNQGLMNLIFNTPAQVPLTSYKDFVNNPFAGYNSYFNDYGLNPYFALDNWRTDGKREDLLSNVEFNYKPLDWLSFTYRAGLNSQNIGERRTSKGETPSSFGLDRGFSPIPSTVQDRAYRSVRISSELFGSVNKQLNDDFKLTAVAGTYVRQTDQKDTWVGATQLVVDNIFNIDNRVGQLTGSSPIRKVRMFSLYGSAGLNYKGWANIEFTGRNDQVSVLDPSNNSFFYPGVNGALVLTDALPELKSDKALTYLKLRAAWSKTGNADIDPYLLFPTYSQLIAGESIGFPFGTLPGFSAGNTNYNQYLKPEFIKSTEFGIETSFFNSRVNFDATYFMSNNDNQIIPISTSSATGYTSAYVNAASFKNQGVELDLRLTPLIKAGDFNFDLRANATYLKSEITSVFDGLDEIAQGGYTLARNYIVKGQPAFVLKTNDYMRDPEGRAIVDPLSGLPMEDANLKIMGQTLPKWVVGINPQFSYKGITLSALFEYKGGHVAYNDIGNAMAWTGVSEITAYNNRERFVLPNSSILQPDGSYVANNSVTINNPNDFFTGVYRDVNSNFVTSAASWRFRELSLSYNVPTSWLAKQKVIKGINVALTGRNLALWLPKSNVYTDPDFMYTGDNTTFGIGNTSGVSTSNTSGISNSTINPPTRMWGGTIQLTF